MSENLPSLLDTLLARLGAGEPVEAILADYPACREQLSSLLRVAEALAPLRAVPRPEHGDARLSRFIAEAQALQSAEPTHRHGWRRLRARWAAVAELSWHPRMRLLAATAVALVTLCVFTGATIALATDSLPGDLIYPVKLAVEEFQLSFSAAPTTQAEYYIARARSRADEIGRLAGAGRPLTEATLARLDRSLEACLNAAAAADAAEIPGLLATIAEMTAQQAVSMAALEPTVHQTSLRDSLVQARLDLTQAQSLAEAGRSDPFAFRLDSQFGFLRIDWWPSKSGGIVSPSLSARLAISSPAVSLTELNPR